MFEETADSFIKGFASPVTDGAFYELVKFGPHFGFQEILVLSDNAMEELQRLKG